MLSMRSIKKVYRTDLVETHALSELTLDVRVGPTQPPSAHRYWVAVVSDDNEVARVNFRMVVMP